MRHGFRRLQAVYDMQHIGDKQKLYYETLPRIQVGRDQENSKRYRGVLFLEFK